MKNDIIEKIKDYHLRICLAIIFLFSSFIFVLGLRFEDTNQFIPWWFALLYGWSGLTVAFNFSSILYKSKK